MILKSTLSKSMLFNEAEYLMKNIMEIEEGVIRVITPSEISIILHMIRKHSITVLLFIQNNS